jgi:hypothetical protein
MDMKEAKFEILVVFFGGRLLLVKCALSRFSRFVGSGWGTQRKTTSVPWSVRNRLHQPYTIHPTLLIGTTNMP